MWYVAYILFAQRPKKGKRRVKCESSHVLLRAKSGLACYRKAVTWARKHERDSAFGFVGVQHLVPLVDERVGDGTEVGGSFFDRYNVWERVNELIPKKHEIPTIRFKRHRHTPVGKLMTRKQKADLREILGENKPKHG